MALTDDDPTLSSAGMQPMDPYAWPPPEWTMPQQSVTTAEYTPALAIPPPPPPPPPVPLPAKDGMTSLGDKNQIAAMGAPNTDETPSGGIALDAPDAPAPANLGELEPDYVGTDTKAPVPEGPQPASFTELPSDVEKQQDQQKLDQLYADTGARTPQDKADIADFYSAKRQADQQRDQVKAAQDADFKAQNENFARMQAAQVKSQQDLAQIDSDAKKISTLNPNRWMQSRSTGQMIAAGIAAFVGGFESFNTGGRNTGLETIQRAIDQDTEAQKFNIAQQQNQIAQRRASTSERLGLQIDAYKAAEAHRAALYDHTIQQIQTAAQDWDPRGSMARQAAQYVGQLQAQRQMGMIDGQKKLADLRKTQADAEHTEAETSQIYSKMGGAGAAGTGSPTNPNYTVATGLFDPFTKQPIYSKEKIKDIGEVKGAIDSYRKVEEQYAKLQAIARRVNGHYTAGTQVWKRFQTTDEAEYNQMRSGLLMSILHARGERPNKDALEAQGALVPDLTKILGSTDTVKMLDDSQSDNDRDIAGYLNLSGVDGNSLIANAQKMRAPAPEPKTDDSITSANEAVQGASTPGQVKDALEGVHQAQAKAAGEAAHKQTVTAALKQVESMGTLAPVPVDPSASPAQQARSQSLADQTETVNQLLARYQALASAKDSTPDAVGAAALAVVTAKHTLDVLTKDAVEQVSNEPHDPFKAKVPGPPGLSSMGDLHSSMPLQYAPGAPVK